MEPPAIDIDFVITVMAWGIAAFALLFVLYLAFRKFGPRRRHRRHHSRMRHLAGKE